MNAEEVHLLTSASFIQGLDNLYEYDLYTTEGRFDLAYYFDGRNTVGALDQFEYINQSSYVAASCLKTRREYRDVAPIFIQWYGVDYFDVRHLDKINIEGRYYYRNMFVGGAYARHDEYINHVTYHAENDYSYAFNSGSYDSYLSNDDIYINPYSYSYTKYAMYVDHDTYRGEIGYLFSDDFEVSLIGVDSDRIDAEFFLNVAYKYQLRDVDYIGARISLNDDIRDSSLSLKYFTVLKWGDYLSAEASLVDEDDWAVDVSYYFNERLSIGINTAKGGMTYFRSKYYFRKNYYLMASYGRDLDPHYKIQEKVHFSVGAQF